MAPKPLQTITPFLWFDGTAEEAMNFYVSIFPNSRTLGVTRYGESGPGPKGSVMTAAFVLNGQEFTALNGGPTMAFTPAISFVVHCETQAEVDEYWVKLTVGGQEGQCGWLTDRFGVSWQVVPNALVRMLQDPKKSNRVVAALMPMKKLEIAALQRAYDQP
ncbi:MAG TPA: VOC family protein [Vicinamibacterales bacterium]|nr:VOC family protein [Vicinamibacterales bacterium]